MGLTSVSFSLVGCQWANWLTGPHHLGLLSWDGCLAIGVHHGVAIGIHHGVASGSPCHEIALGSDHGLVLVVLVVIGVPGLPVPAHGSLCPHPGLFA